MPVPVLSVDRSALTEEYLPDPPDDREKYWYLGRQHRWLLLLQAVSFALIAYSVARFATAAPALLLFLIPMSLYTVTLVVSLASSTRRKRITRADHERTVASWRPDVVPSVDVFLPTAGEPIEVLANTYRHVAALQWHGPLTVYVLDDAARPEVRQLALQHGFTYSSRPDRGRLKKAGNLRHGYEMSDGDLIAIFDADFVPRPDYLFELVPYFDDPETGIVQSPQFFDAVKGMHWLQRCAGATQELFYRWIQPARDRSRAAICVGTCAIYRRAGLQKSGGFAQIGHSEDVHTGVNLMRVGYFVRYVPVLVSKGICPADLASFLNQQYRWCTGSMSLLADATFHANPIIRLRQRVCFWAGFLYYISTGLNAFVAPLPGLVMLYLLPKWIEPLNSVWLLGAVALWFLVLPVVFRSRWRVDVLRVQYLYSFAHAVAIFHVLTGRTKEWVATGAVTRQRTTPLGTQVARVMRVYTTLSLLALWTGLITNTVRFGIEHLWAMDALGLLALYIQVPMLLLKTPAPVRRRARDVVRGWLPRRGARLAVVESAVALPRNAAPIEAPTVAARPEAAGPRVFRPDIQGLRAVAVLMVVLYHAGVPVITGGYAGVDVFFVISGFLITGQVLREIDRTGRLSFRGFYAGRIRRLLPSALVVVLVTAVASRLFDSLLRASSVGWDAIFTTFYALNYRLAAQGVDYQQSDAPASPLQHFWSLAVEEQFYLVWPLLIVLAAVLFRRHRRLAVSVMVAGVLAASFVYSARITDSNAPLAYFSMQTRAWELAAGAAVALLAGLLGRMHARVGALVSWAGLGMIVASAFVFTDRTRFPGTAALLPVLGAALLIGGGGLYRRWGAERLLGSRPFQTVGKLSYGWYLWHWPMVTLIPVILNRPFTWVENLEIMAVALWAAVLSYHLVESPSARSRWKKIAWFGIGGAASVSTAAIALVVVLTVPALIGGGAAAKAVSLDRVGVAELQHTLGVALAARAVPANLTPALAVANADQPASTRDGCHLDFLQTVQPKLPHCTYGDPQGTKTVVLFGDSHAQQWLPALDVAAKTAHWRVVGWTKAACPAASGVTPYNGFLKRVYTECDLWRTTTLANIAALKPDLVLMSQSDNVPGNQVSNTRWADATAQTALQLQGKGLPVLFMMDTPVPGKDAPACIAAHLDNVGGCIVATKNAYSIPGRHQTMAATLRASGVRAVDPVDWFCTRLGCPEVVQNKLVYRDETHMSTPYSAWLAPLVGSIFGKVGQ